MCPFHYITLFSVHQIWEDGRTDTADSWNQILFSKDGFSRTETGKHNDGILDLSNIKNIRVGLYMPQKLSAKGFNFYIKDFGFVK